MIRMVKENKKSEKKPSIFSQTEQRLVLWVLDN